MTPHRESRERAARPRIAGVIGGGVARSNGSIRAYLIANPPPK